MKIIVIEGPDNAGKTTLAMDIAKRMRAVFIKVERPAKGQDLMAFQSLLESAAEYSGIVVVDRHVAISEPIYGTIIRGRHDLNDADIDYCLRRVWGIVLCRPPTDKIMGTLNDRPQMDGVSDHCRSIIEAYDGLLMSMRYTPQRFFLTYDYTTQPNFAPEIVERIMQ